MLVVSLQVGSIEYFQLHNGCQLHYHAAHCLLPIGGHFIRKQIRNKIFITLVILGIYIKIEKMSVGKSSMYIYIFGGQNFNLGTLSSLNVKGWHSWYSGRRCHWFWWTCIHIFMAPTCVEIVCHAIWQWMQPSVWYSWIIGRCHSITAFTFQWPGTWIPHFISSWISSQSSLIRYRVCSIAAHETPPFANLGIFKVRCMSDFSSCTWPPCFAIVADMLTTYKKLVAASENDI